MPNVLSGSGSHFGEAEFLELKKSDLKYSYPDGLDLKPSSKLHKRIVKEVMERARASAGQMSANFSQWNKIDRVLSAIQLQDLEEQELKKKDQRKPTSIVLPYSYSILETLISYMMMAFVDEPIFRYEGEGPEDVIGAMLLERVIDKQCNRTKVALNLHTQFRDSFTYGIGISTPVWKKIYGKKTVKETPGFFSNVLSRFIGTDDEQRAASEEVLLFEGNALNNIDPYLFLPDVNVPIQRIQDGEYVGWVSPSNYMNLRSEEAGSDGSMFNVKYLKTKKNRQTSIYSEQRDQIRAFAQSPTQGEVSNQNVTNTIDVIYMYINLIPKDWELGDSDIPEKWMFAVGSDEIVISAQPLGLNHNMYPVAVMAPESDGYSVTPVSRVSVLSGLQNVLDWFFNSRVTNVRKSINDMFVVDPFLVNMQDMRDPQAGKLIRLRKPAWGKGVQNAVQQLAVNDVTKQNIADANFVIGMMQKVAGADDAVMGSLREGGPERLTEGEFQGTMKGAVNRLKRVAQLVGLQAMQDLGYMFASHCQQLMSQETYVKLTGDWPAELAEVVGPGGQVKVDPLQLAIDYDVKVRDGSVPGNNVNAQMYKMFETIVASPELMQRFDVVKIFKYLMRESGAKNVRDFEIQQAPQLAAQGGINPPTQSGSPTPEMLQAMMGGGGNVTA